MADLYVLHCHYGRHGLFQQLIGMDNGGIAHTFGSVAERDIYYSLLVFMGEAILLTVYRSDGFLLSYSLLKARGILFHMFILQQFNLALRCKLPHLL